MAGQVYVLFVGVGMGEDIVLPTVPQEGPPLLPESPLYLGPVGFQVRIILQTPL
jgi:hypothetical protein